MIAELLEYLHRGGMTLAQIAKEMEIDRDELHERVHMLERSGYLEEVSTAGKDCGSRCYNCPIATTCHDDPSTPRYLLLTRKGKDFLASKK